MIERHRLKRQRAARALAGSGLWAEDL